MPRARRRRRPLPDGPLLNAHDRTAPITDPTLLRLRQERGALTRIAHKLGIKPQALHQWRCVPLEWVNKFELATGIPREILRPDFFGADEQKKCSSK